MKTLIKSLLTGVVALASVSVSHAQLQEETIAMKVVRKGDEPSAIIESIKKDFPDSKIDQVALLPSTLAGKKWAITRENGSLEGTTAQFYEVNAKGKGEQFQAVYDKGGNLLSFSEHLTNVELPAAIREMVAMKYPGWTIARDHERISYRNGVRSVAYRIRLAKGKARKHAVIKEESGVVAVVGVL